MSNLVRSTARLLSGGTYATLGYDAWRAPGPRVDQAAPTLASLRRGAPLPENDELVVHANGALEATAGTLLAVGVVPRLSALVLVGSLLPTIVAGHGFWTIEDPLDRKLQRVQILENMALMGGLLYAALAEPARRKC